MTPNTESQSFVLSGKRYSFSRSELLAAVKGEVPRRIAKYRVEIDGKFFPPKQVVELLTGAEPVSFTTVDAQRVLKKFGFSTESLSGGDSPEDRNVSELTFEQYLWTYGYPFDREPALSQTTRRPDYRIDLGGEPLLFEVKEFSFSKEDSARFGSAIGVVGGGAYDPYVRIRQKIDNARAQFAGITDHVCCLVLFNQEKPLVDLNFTSVYGAMLGPASVSIPYNHDLGKFDTSQSSEVFKGGGKCSPNQNTNLSAVLVLEPLLVGERRFTCHFHKLVDEMDHRPSWEELFELERIEREKAMGTERDPSLFQWRVVVHENPWAKHPLDRNLFRSRFDERFGGVDGHIQAIYRGPAVEELEELEEQYPSPHRKFWRQIRDGPPAGTQSNRSG